MNLAPPPRDATVTEINNYLESMHEFLMFPTFSSIKFIPRTTVASLDEGVVYYGSSDDKLKIRTGVPAWADCNEDPELTIAITASITASINKTLSGLVNRPTFSHDSTTAIKISSGSYHHNGTVEQILYWSSELSHTISNFSSGAFSYIYLDDSAIVTADTNVITATEIIDSTTAPTYSQSKNGWYNGDDRCIFACYCDGASTIGVFYNDGRKVTLDSPVEVQNLAALSSSWTDVTCISPGFSRLAALQCVALGNAASNTYTFIRPNGSSAAFGAYTIGRGTTFNPVESGLTHFDIPTDTVQKVETIYTTSKPPEYSLSSSGWYLPNGL